MSKEDKITNEQKIACLIGVLPILMDYVEDLKYDYPSVYKRKLKKSGDDFINETLKWTDNIYSTICDNPDVKKEDFTQHIVNVGTNFEEYIKSINI